MVALSPVGPLPLGTPPVGSDCLLLAGLLHRLHVELLLLLHVVHVVVAPGPHWPQRLPRMHVVRGFDGSPDDVLLPTLHLARAVATGLAFLQK